MLLIKYKPVFKVELIGEQIGYVSSQKMIEETIKRVAVAEFGTLDGVEIQYTVNLKTGCIQYCIWRK